jgi:hypothetical protein
MLDRKPWKAPFKHELPSLPCGNCAVGFLHPISDTTKEIETGEEDVNCRSVRRHVS